MLVNAQGGDVAMVDGPQRLPRDRLVEDIPAGADGFVAAVDALAVAQATLELGAGRARKSDPIDPAVGVVVRCKVGDQVRAGDPLFTIHANDGAKLAQARALLEQAVQFSEGEPQPLPAFYDTLYSEK